MNTTAMKCQIWVADDYRNYDDCMNYFKLIGIVKYKHFEVTYNAQINFTLITIDKPEWREDYGTEE